MAFPLVRRSTMEAALDAQLGRYNALMGERDREIAFLRSLAEFNGDSAMRQRAELNRLRAHFDATVKAKDEAYARIAAEKDQFMVRASAAEDEAFRLEADVGFLQGYADQCVEYFFSLGIRDPHDWAAPLPPWLSTVVTADCNGVRGEIDPGINLPPGDPRGDMSQPMGLGACSARDSNS